jgi:16S rRNA (guanine527-N7)-methyltransferase
MSVAPGSLKLGAAERRRLSEGGAELGVALDDVALERFVAYAEVLDRWRGTTNLISCRTAAELIDRHLLDALGCAWLCGAARSIVDLGSGAGLPGVPLAIVKPDRRVVLVEPRRRRASFLREVRRVLTLPHVEVLEARAEDADREHFARVDVAVCRAVWSDDEAARTAAPWITEGGLLLCVRSADQPSFSIAGDRVLPLEQVVTYRVPGGPKRRIEVHRKQAS